MLSFSQEGTKIVLIGTTSCPKDPVNLPELPSVGNNIRELEKIFKDETIIGLPSRNVEVIIDPPSSTQILEKLSEAAETATDTLFVYYAGHGIKSSSDDGLFIATRETSAKLCHINGVDFQKMRKIIHQSIAVKKILIFDCCYSGEITSEEMGGSDESVIANNIQIRGVYSIASAPRNSKAFAPNSEIFTAFTKELVSIFKDGIDEMVEYMTLDQVYRELRSRIASNPSLPTPQQKILLDAKDFVVAKNLRFTRDPEIRIRNIERKYQILLDTSLSREKNALSRLEKTTSRTIEIEKLYNNAQEYLKEMEKRESEAQSKIQELQRAIEEIELRSLPNLGKNGHVDERTNRSETDSNTSGGSKKPFESQINIHSFGFQIPVEFKIIITAFVFLVLAVLMVKCAYGR